MKLLLLVIYFLSVLFFSSSCRQTDTQDAFHWVDTNNVKRLVFCDTGTCAKCSTYVDGAWMVYDTVANADVYNECKGYGVKRSPPPPPPSGPVINIGGTELVRFNVYTPRWGWDGYRDNIAEYGTNNYVSMETNGGANFSVTINTQSYLRFIATIVNDNTGGVSFVENVHCVRCTLSVGKTTVAIYANSSTTGTAQIKIVGESRSDSCCLAGPDSICSGSQDQLEVRVYKRNIISGCRLYLINNPSYNPSQFDWTTMFNSVLKQAVATMDTVEKIKKDDNTWDYNKNNKLDTWIGKGITAVIPPDRLELPRLILNIKDTTHSIGIIMPSEFNRNYLIMADAIANDSMLTLYSTDRLFVDDTILVSPWIGSTDTETVVIRNILPQNRIKLTGSLKHKHNKYDIVIADANMNGITIGNFSCIHDKPNNQTVIHEFLHQLKIANLPDVLDKDNIMYMALIGRTDTKLRYRSINCEDGSVQSQWDYINK